MKTLIKFFSIIAIALSFSFAAFSASNVKVDTAKSTFKWTGKKKFIDDKHTGTIKLKSAEATITKGVVTDGLFVMDMNTLDVTDITNKKKKGQFLGHIKTGDFFQVDKHPEAKLDITGSAGKNKVKADLTIKGITKPVEVSFTQKGKTYTGKLVVDRTQFGIEYGTEGFLKKAQKFVSKRVIDNNFDIEFTIVTM